MKDFLTFNNNEVIRASQIPVLDFNIFREALIKAEDMQLLAFFPLAGSDPEILTAILLDPAEHKLHIAGSCCGKKYLSLTCDAPRFHWFERELAERYGFLPEGHPWLKPIRRADGEYFTMSGDAVNEVAVGPVHAGVIEPGHFRFQCMGEKVYSLEISLGYQSRGVEQLLCAPYSSRTLPIMESTAGDTAAAAADGGARLIESLSGIAAPLRAQALRAVMAELERVANHTGDLGALAGDVAYLPTASFCGRIRGEYLNMSAEICGNRFGRNYILPGRVRYDADSARCGKLLKWMEKVNAELKHALDLMFDSPTVLDRFENTGTVDLATAASIGMVGPAARASGSNMDCRRDIPYGYYIHKAPEIAGTGQGDVLSRAKVRYDEINSSLKYIGEVLSDLPEGNICSETKDIRLVPDSLSVSVSEAWRGTLCQIMVTGQQGEIKQCRIVDPSFHNWFGLAMALRNEEISNFPICNKSFNLSYCGHDL